MRGVFAPLQLALTRDDRAITVDRRPAIFCHHRYPQVSSAPIGRVGFADFDRIERVLAGGPAAQAPALQRMPGRSQPPARRGSR